MKKKTLRTLAFSFTLLLFIGCSDEEPLKLSNLEVAVKNGRVKFNSTDELGIFMNSAKSASSNEFRTTIKNLEESGFNSLQPEVDFYNEEVVARVEQRKYSEMELLVLEIQTLESMKL